MRETLRTRPERRCSELVLFVLGDRVEVRRSLDDLLAEDEVPEPVADEVDEDHDGDVLHQGPLDRLRRVRDVTETRDGTVRAVFYLHRTG